MEQPNRERSPVEQAYPSVARWVQGYGWIEIGPAHMTGSSAGWTRSRGHKPAAHASRHWSPPHDRRQFANSIPGGVNTTVLNDYRHWVEGGGLDPD